MSNPLSDVAVRRSQRARRVAQTVTVACSDRFVDASLRAWRLMASSDAGRLFDHGRGGGISVALSQAARLQKRDDGSNQSIGQSEHRAGCFTISGNSPEQAAIFPVERWLDPKTSGRAY